jgi:hypothetical protein
LHHAYAAQAEVQRAERACKRNLLILVELLATSTACSSMAASIAALPSGPSGARRSRS